MLLMMKTAITDSYDATTGYWLWVGSARCRWHALRPLTRTISIHGRQDVGLVFTLGDDNNAKTIGQLATIILSAGNVRFDTGGPGKMYGAPSL
jgi:hypothetical protein